MYLLYFPGPLPSDIAVPAMLSALCIGWLQGSKNNNNNKTSYFCVYLWYFPGPLPSDIAVPVILSALCIGWPRAS